MANIRFGPLVSEVRGSIGGTTFLRTKAGPAARGRVKPTTSVSNDAGTRRATLSALVQRWSLTLIETQRQAWRDLAAITNLINSLGEVFHPTGLQLYVRQNAFVQILAGPFSDDPPTQAIIDIPLFYHGYTAGIGFQITEIGYTPITNGFVYAQRTGPWALGRHSQRGPMTTSRIIDVTTMPPLPYTLWAAADLVASKSYFFRYRIYDTDSGGLSAPIFLTGQTPAIL